MRTAVAPRGRRLGAFGRLALAMAGLGALVGLAFPVFTDLLGVPASSTHTPVFRAACLAAGLLLAAANHALARRFVGRRLALLADALQEVSRAVEDGGEAGAVRQRTRWEGLGPEVRGRDDLGATAAAFSALLTALEQAERFRAAMRTAGDVTLVVGADGVVTFASDAVVGLTGWPVRAVVGRRAVDLVHPEDADAVRAALAPTGPPGDGEPGAAATRAVVRVSQRRRAGELAWIWVELSRSSDRDDDAAQGPAPGAAALGTVVIARDVTEQRRLERRLEHQASHDGLTGLPNRSALLQRTADLLQTPAASPLSMLLLDLDGFKEVNDTLGHDSGDRVLEQVGPRLRAGLRAEDLLARLGGDEFAVLLPRTDAEGARTAAQHLLEQLRAPVVVDGRALAIGASVGVSCSTTAVPPGTAPEAAVRELLRGADTAMYTAKRARTGVEVDGSAAPVRRGAPTPPSPRQPFGAAGPESQQPTSRLAR